MSTNTTSLGDLLFGQTRGGILGMLFGSPTEGFYVRQIARRVDISAGTVLRELTTLANAGLILRTQNGNQVHYRANENHPVFAEMRELLAKTTGIFQQLTQALAPFAKRIKFAFVYGSFARGEEAAASDIDLMVAGAVTLDELLEELAPLERTLRRPINPTVYSEPELQAKLHAGNHFLKAIQKGKNIFLIGDELEFRKLR